MRHRAMLGLDQDGPELYLVELHRLREGPFLRSAQTLASAAEGLDPALLRRIAQSAVLKAAAAALPRAVAVQRELTIPPLDPVETKAAVIAAFEGQVPFAASDICPGWLTGSNGGGILTTVAAPRAQVESLRDALSSAGLSPARLEIRTGAAASAFYHGYRDELAGQAAILVELRREESSLIVLREGSVLYTRPLPGLGGDEAPRLGELAAELQSTYALLHTRTDWREPEHLYLTGFGAARSEICRRLAALIGVAPEQLRVAKPRGLLRAADLPEPGPEFLVAAGLCLAALGFEALGPDLLPGLVDLAKRQRAALLLPAGLALLMTLAGLAVMSDAVAKRQENIRSWLAEHRAEAVTLREQKKKTAEQAARLASLRSYGRNSQNYLDLLLALDEAMPPGTRIQRISLKGEQVETLAGTTPSVTLLLQRIQTHPLLSGLSLRGPVLTRTEGGAVCEVFTLAGPLAVREAKP